MNFTVEKNYSFEEYTEFILEYGNYNSFTILNQVRCGSLKSVDDVTATLSYAMNNCNNSTLIYNRS